MRKLVGLQWARALAAVTVAIAHGIVHPMSGAPGIFHMGGQFGVTLFFVISGYIMVVTTGQGPFDPVQFMKRRILRIVPLYYVAMGIAALGVLAAPWAFKDTVFDLRHIVLSSLFIPMAEPGQWGQITPFFKLGWTLNYEMFFYVVFAALAAFSALSRALALTALFVGLAVVGLIFRPAFDILSFYTQMIPLAFVGGVWVAILTRQSREPMSVRSGGGVLLVAAVSLLAMAAVYDAVESRPVSDLWMTASCALIVLALARAPQVWVEKVPGFAAYLGDASYSIYLFHMFAVGAAYVVAKKLGVSASMSVGVAAGFAGVAAGLVAYRLIESPITRWIQGATRSRAAAPQQASA